MYIIQKYLGLFERDEDCSDAAYSITILNIGFSFIKTDFQCREKHDIVKKKKFNKHNDENNQ